MRPRQRADQRLLGPSPRRHPRVAAVRTYWKHGRGTILGIQQSAITVCGGANNCSTQFEESGRTAPIPCNQVLWCNGARLLPVHSFCAGGASFMSGEPPCTLRVLICNEKWTSNDYPTGWVSRPASARRRHRYMALMRRIGRVIFFVGIVVLAVLLLTPRLSAGCRSLGQARTRTCFRRRRLHRRGGFPQPLIPPLPGVRTAVPGRLVRNPPDLCSRTGSCCRRHPGQHDRRRDWTDAVRHCSPGQDSTRFLAAA